MQILNKAKRNTPAAMYEVTATDDTKIRFVKYTGLNKDQALCAKNEILYQVPKKLFNPRIRKTKNK